MSHASRQVAATGGPFRVVPPHSYVCGDLAHAVSSHFLKQASRRGAYAGSNFQGPKLPASSGRWIVVGVHAHLLCFGLVEGEDVVVENRGEERAAKLDLLYLGGKGRRGVLRVGGY